MALQYNGRVECALFIVRCKKDSWWKFEQGVGIGFAALDKLCKKCKEWRGCM